MPPTADADAVLAREQATEATALWAVGEFDAAHQTLQRLDATLPSDARVQLNLWTAGYYADATSSLESIGKEIEAWLKSNSPDPTDCTQWNVRPVAAVNHALILFLQQQHAAALSVLEPLFEEVDLLQDGTALCTCVLLLEVYLDSMQLPKAVQVLEYLQGLSGPRGSEALCSSDGPAPGDAAGSSTQQAAADKPHSQQDRKDGGPVGPAGGAAAGAGGQQEAGGGAGAGRHVALSEALPVVSKTRSSFMQEVDQLVERQGGSLPGRDLSPLLHLYKARLALACHNHKAAKKEVRALLSCEPDSTAAVLLKSQLEAMRHQPRKALKSLGPLLAAPPELTSRCRLQLLNLLGAVHHQLHKHNLAALYLTTALNQHQEAQQQQQPKLPSSSKQEQQRKQQGKRQPKKQQQQQGKAGAAEPAAGAAGGKEGAVGVSRPNHWLVQDNSDALYYNLGLQHLALQDWQAAMECFEAASCKFFTLPQLWLRWGEACIGLSHQQQQQLSSQQEVAAAVAAAAPAQGKLGAAKGGRGAPAGKKQQQQQQASNPQQLLQQAAAHLSTGLVILQEQQAAAAKQLEAATAAAAAALAAGEPSAQLAGPSWTMAHSSAAAAGLPADGHDAAGASSSSAAPASTSSPSSRPAAVEGGAAGPNTPTAAVGPAAVGPGMPVLSSWAAEAALLAPELAAVKQSLLANQAYVYLALNQPDEALAAALELVSCSSMSPQQHYLGSTYAAEALCLLGRVDDASLQLKNHMDMFPHGSSTMAGAVPAAAAATAAASTGGPAGIASSSAAAAGAAGPSDAGTTIAAAGSIKSYDGSCVSCARDACGHSGQWGSPEDQGDLRPEARAAALQNMAAVLLLQGDLHESQRHAAMAASLAAAAAGQQDAPSASGMLPSGGQGRGPSF